MQKVEAEIWPWYLCTKEQSESFAALGGCTGYFAIQRQPLTKWNFGRMSQVTSLLTALSFRFGTAWVVVQQKHFKEIQQVIEVNCPQI